jgi:hypothetical protein
MGSPVYAYEVSVVGRDWSQVVNASTRGRAKKEYHRDLLDSWPDIPFTALRARKLGPAQSSSAFIRCAEYRGVSLRCGQAVAVHCGPGVLGRGVVVGHNASANFDVLFDADSPRHAGLRLNVHPSEIEVVA